MIIPRSDDAKEREYEEQGYLLTYSDSVCHDLDVLYTCIVRFMAITYLLLRN